MGEIGHLFNPWAGLWGVMLVGMIDDETRPVQDYGSIPEGGAPVLFRFDDPRWLNVRFLDGDGGVALELDYDATGNDGAQRDDSFFLRYVETDGGSTVVPHVVTKPPLPAGQRLRISRATPLEQMLELPANAPLPARALERALDQLTMALQDQEAENGGLFRNVLSFPPGEPADSPTQLPLAPERAGCLLGFHAQTGRMELVSTEGIVVEASVSQLEELVERVDQLRSETEVSFHQAYQLATRNIFYRDETTDGMKFGVIGNPDLLDQPGYMPGAKSLTIQPGSDSLAHRAKGQFSTAIGYSAHAEEDYGVSIGTFSETWGVRAVGLGHGAVGRALNAVAVGHGAHAAVEYSVAVGTEATTEVLPGGTSSGCVALGYLAKAAGKDSSALGTAAEARGASALAVGTEAVATGNHQTSIGHGAGSAAHPAARSLSLGAYSKTLAAESCAVGIRCTAGATGGTAVGVDAMAEGAGSTAVGWNSRVYAADGCAFGYGNEVRAAGARSTAIGHGVVLQVPDSVDIRAGTAGPRLFLSAGTGAAQLSYRTSDVQSTPTTAVWGSEPAPVGPAVPLPLQMLSFRVNAANTVLFIDVAVPGSIGPIIKTASLPLTL